MPEPRCPHCRQLIVLDDTVESYGDGVVHVNCGNPRSVSPEENVFLYVYCWEHEVAECAACSQTFRQDQLGADPIGSYTYECPRCRANLSESIRAHLTACTMLPEQLRRRVRVAREVAQRLIKRSYELADRANVLMREAETARAVLNEARAQARRMREKP